MAYEPTNWKSGDVVTSAKLNKLEQAVASGGVMIVEYQEDGVTFNKTWQEIYDALAGKLICVAIGYTNDDNYVSANQLLISEAFHAGGEGYTVYVGSDQFSVDSPTGYPSLVNQ